jgi:hypothetical protein
MKKTPNTIRAMERTKLEGVREQMPRFGSEFKYLMVIY